MFHDCGREGEGFAAKHLLVFDRLPRTLRRVAKRCFALVGVVFTSIFSSLDYKVPRQGKGSPDKPWYLEILFAINLKLQVRESRPDGICNLPQERGMDFDIHILHLYQRGYTRWNSQSPRGKTCVYKTAVHCLPWKSLYIVKFFVFILHADIRLMNGWCVRLCSSSSFFPLEWKSFIFNASTFLDEKAFLV